MRSDRSSFGLIFVALALGAGTESSVISNPASGPNVLQNYPVLASAARSSAGGGIEVVAGTLASAPNATYRLDLYHGSGCGAGGRGAAIYPLMKTYVTTDALGVASFTTSVPFPFGTLPLGVISATVTDAGGNTSETGNCVAETSDDTIFADGFD